LTLGFFHEAYVSTTATKTRLIRTYAANGARLRDRSQESVETLEALGKVSVRRSKRGTMTVCQFRSEANGANPIAKTAHLGQVYSFRQELPSGHRVWKHRALVQNMAVEALFGEPVEDAAELDKYVRSIYLTVALSVTTQPTLPKTPANVVNIADYAHKRRETDKKARRDAPRPIEFDSQLRRQVATRVA
jgi:hypothetical protein